MRKVLGSGLTVVVLVLAAIPAGAATKPATANQLVTKLVKAGICTSRTSLNAGTKVQCIDSTSPAGDVHLVVSAFPKRVAMLSDLAVDRAAPCRGELPGSPITIPPPASVDYLVGPNWWTPPFTGTRQQAVMSAIGGKLTTYPCT